MLKEIASFISTRTGWTMGPTEKLQFGHRLPTSSDRCVLIAFNGGGQGDFYLTDRKYQMVQVLARAKSYLDAYADSVTVYDAIHGLQVVELPVLELGKEYEAQTIEAIGLPQYIGPDSEGRHEWSTNFIFRIKDAT